MNMTQRLGEACNAKNEYLTETRTSTRTSRRSCYTSIYSYKKITQRLELRLGMGENIKQGIGTGTTITRGWNKHHQRLERVHYTKIGTSIWCHSENITQGIGTGTTVPQGWNKHHPRLEWTPRRGENKVPEL